MLIIPPDSGESEIKLRYSRVRELLDRYRDTQHRFDALEEAHRAGRLRAVQRGYEARDRLRQPAARVKAAPRGK